MKVSFIFSFARFRLPVPLLTVRLRRLELSAGWLMLLLDSMTFLGNRLDLSLSRRS